MEHHNTYRKFESAPTTEDTRSLFEITRDAILRSPTGEPFYMDHEQARVSELSAQEEASRVIVEAEGFISDAVRHVGQVAVPLSGELSYV